MHTTLLIYEDFAELTRNAIISHAPYITDELQNSATAVREMVASWMPSKTGKGMHATSIIHAIDGGENFGRFRGRPERYAARST